MRDLLARVREAEAVCGCGHHHPITVERVETEPGASRNLADYIREKGWSRLGVVSDAPIWERVGGRLAQPLQACGAAWSRCLVLPDEQGDVVADERAIVQVLVDIPPDMDAYVAVGSGTLHDIVRFAASRTGKPFVSIPTAPSVDGFASAGAPILLRGFKRTIQTAAPIAIFADPEVYGDAPRALAAAGFGDMLGKHTSLFDWTFSHAMAGEPWCLATEALTREALELCEEAVGAIAAGKPDGLRALMDALLLSGLSMQLFGASHPASGAEHHLSHDWEMELLRRRSRQLLHGAKVGVACSLIAERYAEWAPEVEALGRPELTAALAHVLSAERIRLLLRQVGGPSTPNELGIDAELVEASFRRAHTHRDRGTLLRWHNERAGR